MIYKNKIPLIYNLSTGEIKEDLPYLQDYLVIWKDTKWVLIKDKEHNFTLLNSKGMSVPLNDKSAKWFKKGE